MCTQRETTPRTSLSPLQSADDLASDGCPHLRFQQESYADLRIRVVGSVRSQRSSIMAAVSFSKLELLKSCKRFLFQRCERGALDLDRSASVANAFVAGAKRGWFGREEHDFHNLGQGAGIIFTAARVLHMILHMPSNCHRWKKVRTHSFQRPMPKSPRHSTKRYFFMASSEVVRQNIYLYALVAPEL